MDPFTIFNLRIITKNAFGMPHASRFLFIPFETCISSFKFNPDFALGALCQFFPKNSTAKQ